MKRKKKTIGRKVTVLLLSAVCCAVLLTGSISVWSLNSMKGLSGKTSRELGNKAAEDAEAALEQLAGQQLKNLAQEKAAFLNEKFSAIEAYVHGIASLAEAIYNNPEDYPDRNVAYPKKNSHELAAQLLWSSKLIEPDREQLRELQKLGNVQDLLVQYNAQNDMVSSAYLATVNGWMLQADYIAYSKYESGGDFPDFYEADIRQWYQRALLAEQGETVYSDVIRDAHGGGDCIVCAQPVYYNGKIVAVAGIGSYLETVNNAVLNTTIGKSGYAFLVNQDGQIMVSPKKQGETAAYAEEEVDLRYSSNSGLAKAAKDMVSGYTGLTRLILDNQKVYLAYAPLPELKWSFGTVMAVEEVVAPAKKSQKTILALTDQVAAKQNKAIQRMLLSILAIIPIAFLGVSVFGTAFSRKISYPLCKLTKDVAKLSSGNLDYQIEVSTGDEVEDLGRAFNQMTAKLKEHIHNLACVTAEKERIRTELQVASRLQADMLPDPAGALANQKEFSLHALMTPAKEVGGDFYDFFLLDEDHLALVVADVSGKGVPAALFMVVSKTMIRSGLSSHRPLSETAAEINNALCRDNQDGMFVTAWLAVLTLSTGELAYVNAGHCHPLLKRGGEYVFLSELGGMMLAGLEESRYQESKIQLQPGDVLYQCSDGVTEAHNESKDLYGEERLRLQLNESLKSNPHWDPKQLIEAVWKDLEEFRGTAEQFDDITMLAVCYHGIPTSEENSISNLAQMDTDNKQTSEPEDFDNKESITIVHSPDLEKLQEMSEHIEITLQNRISRESMASILVAVDEIYSNICMYSHAARMECTCQIKDGVATLRFQDDGEAYNPLAKTDPNVGADLADRDIGGLGIYLVKQQMDEVSYQYQNGKNSLTLIKGKEPKRI